MQNLPFTDLFYKFLKNSIADGGNNAICAIENCVLNNSDVEIKSPAMIALICWGERGLATIKNIALSDPTSKNISVALKAFAVLAAGEKIQSLMFFILDENLTQIINENLLGSKLRYAARHQLAEMILSLSSDDLLIPMGVSFQQLPFFDGDLVQELVSGLSAKWLRFGPPTLKIYEEMLKKNAKDEFDFQKFFVRYPQFLDPMAVQVWSQPDFHGALEPDFIIRRTDNSYLIVEIECPEKSIVTLGNQMSAEATHAEKQATDYKNFLAERIQEAQKHFPYLRDPDCLVVIGMEEELSEIQKNALSYTNTSRHKLRIVGFDWLSERARAMISNMSLGEIDVIARHRMI